MSETQDRHYDTRVVRPCPSPDTSTSDNSSADTSKSLSEMLVIIGKPSTSNTCEFYVELDRPVVKIESPHVLGRYADIGASWYSAADDRFRPLLDELLQHEACIGIKSVRVGANFFAPAIREHFLTAMASYLDIIVMHLATGYEAALKVYVIEEHFSLYELETLRWVFPQATYVADSEAFNQKRHAEKYNGAGMPGTTPQSVAPAVTGIPAFPAEPSYGPRATS